MNTTMKYLVKIHWSDEDAAYVAKVPALPGCIAYGESYHEAAEMIEEAASLWLESAANHHDPIPEPDLAAEEIRRLAPLLNVSKLARAAGVNGHTLATKLRRGSRFSQDEASRILRALEQA